MVNCQAQGNCSDQTLEMSPALVAVESSLIFLIMVASMVCNVLVGLVIMRKPDMISWSANKLLLNLTVANFVLSVSVLPFVFTSSLKRRWLFGSVWCNISGFLTILLCTASLWTTMFLSIDRYHCIVNSLNYVIIMSPTKTYIYIASSWGLSFFIAILPIAGWGSTYGFTTSISSCTVVWDSAQSDGYTKFYAFAAFICPLIVMFWAYYHILKAARRQARVGQIAVVPQSIRGSISSNASVFTGSKALRTTFLVLGAIIFLWGPYVIVMLLKSSRVTVSHGVEITVVLLSFSSAVVYPGIYGFRVRAIKREIKRFVSPLLCVHSNVVRPFSASETGFLLSQPTYFRNRSVSEGCLDLFQFTGRMAGTGSGVPCGLPVIHEEGEADSNNPKSKTTDLTDLEFSTDIPLPGRIT